MTERDLLEHEHRYRAIVESQIEMVCRFRRDGTILFVNAAYAQARATTAEALIGASFWEFVPEQDRESVAAMLDNLSLAHPEVRIENRFETADGVRWTLWTNRALTFDAHGRALELQSSGLDITERRLAEEALRKSEQRYRTIFETAGVSIWDKDFSAVKRALDDLRRDGVTDVRQFLADHPEWVDRAIDLVRIREVNPTTLRMFGAEDDSALRQSLRTTFVPETRDLFVAELLAIAEGRQTLETETRFRRLDGRTLDVLFSMRLPPPDGPFDSILVTLTDITERKRAEQAARESELQVRRSEEHFRKLAAALQASNQAKDEFLATLSHELRTPLNAVLGWTHMLRSGTLPPEVAARALESLERNAKVQTQMIDDLLDMSRIISGRLHLSREIVDLGGVISAAVDTVRPAAVLKGVELHTVLTGEQVVVRGDPHRLRQILWNLLTNAIKFTPAGGQVHVSLRGTTTHVDVMVKDTGEGITPDFMPYVFERFRQADASSTRRHGGLGIGLSIARHLADEHGGAILVESEGQHRGATFTLRLPRLSLSDVQRISGDLAARGNRALQGVQALVVTSDADMRELLRVSFELSGATVITTRSSAEALGRLTSDLVDLLVVDLTATEQDSLELLRAVRTLSGVERRLAAVAITEYASEHEREQTAIGFNARVTKPLNIEQMLRTVGEILKIQHALD